MKIADSIIYVGVNDHEIDLFEGQYVVPEGMSYNSYVITDEKIAVMDTVDAGFTAEWLDNVEKACEGRTPDYLIVQHMEPDHSGSIAPFMEKYPEACVVASDKAFGMMKKFYGSDYPERRVVIKEGDTLDLGSRALTFVAAPMVHWPEVMVTYDAKTKTLFSADGFGKFGALDSEDDDWACEARRYYFGIVGKFGMQVQNLLKKASALEIENICPLHGPVLTEDLGYYLDLYNTWSSYGVETEGVTIAYTSVYGNTKKAVMELAKALEEKGCPKVAVSDLARDDMAEVVEDAFRYGKLILATTTYNGGIFPFMHDFISHLVDHGYQNRKIAFVENGTWAPMAAKKMRAELEGLKNITFAENTVTINGGVNEDVLAQIDALADEMK